MLDGLIMQCKSDGTCFNLDDGKFYKVDGDTFKKCDDCGSKEELSKLLEERRVNNGGPTSAEKRGIYHFSALESAQTGAGKLFGLFMSDESLAKWRNTVDNFFCSTVLFGGKDCWVSKICGEYTDKTYDGSLIIETPGGMLDTAAHVEGERQDLLFVEEGVEKEEYLYMEYIDSCNP